MSASRTRWALRYCIAEASLAAAGLVGPSQGEWLDRVPEDLESYRAALTSLIQRDRPAEASDIASALEFFWVIRGHSIEGLDWDVVHVMRRRRPHRDLYGTRPRTPSTRPFLRVSCTGVPATRLVRSASYKLCAGVVGGRRVVGAPHCRHGTRRETDRGCPRRPDSWQGVDEGVAAAPGARFRLPGAACSSRPDVRAGRRLVSDGWL